MGARAAELRELNVIPPYTRSFGIAGHLFFADRVSRLRARAADNRMAREPSSVTGHIRRMAIDSRAWNLRGCHFPPLRPLTPDCASGGA